MSRRLTTVVCGLLAASALGIGAGPAGAAVSPDGPPVPYGQEVDHRPASGLLAVGDLDGNGVKDLLETRVLPGTEGKARDLGLLARDGRRGVELWRRTVRLAAHEGASLQALRRAGSNRPAALLTIEGSRLVDGKNRQTRRLLGLDLSSNSIVWRASFEDVFFVGADSSDRCSPCTRTVGLVAAARGAGQDVLLATLRSRTAESGPPSFPGGPRRELTPPADVQLRRLDTGTGVVSNVGPTVTTDQPAPSPEVTADLDGDRREDVLLRGETGRSITAVSGRTGALLWRSERLPQRRTVSRTHPDRDGRVDLIVPTWAGDTADDHDERPAYEQPQVALLDGATGRVRWRQDGEDAEPLGATAGLPTVGLVDLTLVKGSTTTSTATTTALDRTGLPRWRSTSTLTSSGPKAELNAFDRADLADAGDTDGDGQRELLLVHELEEGAALPKRVTTVLSGATGRAGQALDGAALPLRAPLRGAGADLVTTVKPSSGQPLQLVGLDGAGQAVLWRRALPGTASGVRAAGVDAVRLYATGCRSLLVTTFPRTTHAVVRADGALAWSVTPSSSSLFGGAVTSTSTTNAAC